MESLRRAGFFGRALGAEIGARFEGVGFSVAGRFRPTTGRRFFEACAELGALVRFGFATLGLVAFALVDCECFGSFRAGCFGAIFLRRFGVAWRALGARFFGLAATFRFAGFARFPGLPATPTASFCGVRRWTCDRRIRRDPEPCDRPRTESPAVRNIRSLTLDTGARTWTARQRAPQATAPRRSRRRALAATSDKRRSDGT